MAIIGRPPKYSNPEEMQALIDAYFAECDEKEKPYTITGLALALNMTRQGLIDYQNKDAFADTVKRAKLYVEADTEARLQTARNPAGIIFALKNNYNWRDKQEVDASISVVDASSAIQAARERAKGSIGSGQCKAIELDRPSTRVDTGFISSDKF